MNSFLQRDFSFDPNDPKNQKPFSKFSVTASSFSPGKTFSEFPG